MDVRNFLPEQYERTGILNINHNYLAQQFSDYEIIFDKLKKVVLKGDFTLGSSVDELENKFQELIKAKHAIGVGSGTDALFLSLKALGIGTGDEVITTPFTFYATIGAIVTAGATPVFVDILEDFNLNPELIKAKITPRTKAILPVHWAGKPCHMQEIMAIANQHGLYVIEDACHAIQAHYQQTYAGTFGQLGCFSFHPLKNLNVWGDGGMIVTNDDNLSNKLRLMRNHGLKGRDECVMFSFNSRLDTLQAVVALHLMEKLDFITASRIANANYYDHHLSTIDGIRIPKRESNVKQVYHLYCILCDARDELQQYLIQQGVDAKIHYPTPMHLQPAAHYLGYKHGDFPVCERMSQCTLSLPVHEFLTQADLDYVIFTIRKFYANRCAS